MIGSTSCPLCEEFDKEIAKEICFELALEKVADLVIYSMYLKKEVQNNEVVNMKNEPVSEKLN